MEYDVQQLEALLDACHRVLPNLEGRDDHLAETIRETCRGIEAQLADLSSPSR
jgi:hypothetical protein